jgi:hypothetical protein
MPVMTVVTQRSGRPVVGFRWGTQGKVYTGPGAQAKAALQGSAIRAAGYRGKIARDNK